ncbi:Beta-lactamase domain-containing protein [Fusarium falciforme]|uniref:Beta-lactamase domain-containing protein n=1 Tax=Fusarium falciforme TaxID=195108 RepID=UPI002300B77A|nr:Beta-lactamase domain-containing protein [Fusarium falciforme]WAO95744.1 Beta-lactamase domain-containing protein [Fusarium falciforme]
MRTFSLSLLSLALSSLGQSLPTEECPILGPVLPSGFDLSRNKAFKDAKSAFPKAIEALFDAGVLNDTQTAFAIDVFSTATNESLYSYYHTGKELKSTLTTGELDDGTIFRIGSVSKIYTVYSILAHAGLEIFNHPVTFYVPELLGNAGSDPLSKIKWEDVTVGTLAAQQGGTGGVPLEAVTCHGSSKGCTTEDFLAIMKDKKHPVALPFRASLYSDAGFALLGVVLQRITGLTYNDAIQAALAAPLGLNSSTTFEPNDHDVNALILPGSPAESSWGFDNQVTAPSGGIYASAADLRRLGVSILESQLLSPRTTRQWLKPLGGTASLTYAVGAPWEINRLTLPVTPGSNRTRVSDLYTKLGGNAGYAAVFALSPDHEIGFSVLVAGPTAVSDRIPLRDVVGTVFVPAAEHAAVENAGVNYAGVFVDESDATSNLTLTIDKGHPGLGLESWNVNGVDWRANLTLPGADPILAASQTIRLYPLGPETEEKSSSGDTRRIAFRSVAQIKPISPRAEVEGGEGMFDNGCQTWFDVGFWDSLDEFVFEVVDGKVVSVENAITQQVLKRVSE